MKRLRLLGGFLLFCLVGIAFTQGHVPVPDSVLNPQTPEEAWNVLRLVTDNVERLLKENRLPEIADQVSLCAPALRLLPKGTFLSPESKRQVAVESVQSSVAITSLAQASMFGDRATTETMFAALRHHLDTMASAYDPQVTKAEIYSCPMHPDVVSADPTAHCGKCGMNLILRRIPYSFVYVPAGEPSIKLSAESAEPMVAGQPCSVKIRLTHHDGTPVILPELLVMHTQPIHLLIIAPGLTDYHHEHPIPTGVPGEYAFSFTPKTGAAYRIFADVVPAATGVQEYPWTELLGAEQTVMNATAVQGPNTFTAQSDGLDFTLKLAEGQAGNIRAGQVCALSISIKDAVSGKAVNMLEPVMNAFAHLVGFYGDSRTVVHLHPLGAEVTDQNLRGGPTLEFKFYPPKAGFIRLYCQIQLRGRAIYCPFGINVAP